MAQLVTQPVEPQLAASSITTRAATAGSNSAADATPV
jgi:hypothetical protein